MKFFKDFIKLFENKDYEDYFDYYMDNLHRILYSLKDKKHIKINTINPFELKKAFSEFTKYGEIFRFPIRKILNWKELIINNIAFLHASTELAGHSENFPIDDINDVFDKNFQNYSDASDFLEQYDKYFPRFSNNEYLLSDYGLNNLINLAIELLNKEKPEDILVTISKILNVAHQRSDLAEIFVKGGTNSLDFLNI